MSQAQIEKFITALAGDPERLLQATQGATDLSQSACKLVQYAASRGYDFTEDEAQAWLSAQKRQPAGGELHDSQLDGVAGGIIIIGSRSVRGETNPLSSSAIKTGWGTPPDDNKTL